MTDITIRPILSSEYHVLEEFLYLSVFLPPGIKALP
jgi:hypothetical protein